MRRFASMLALGAVLAGPVLAQASKGGDGGGSAPATVVVENQLDKAVAVWIDGELKGKIEPGGQARFDGVPEGPVDLQAGVAGSAGPVAGETRTLEAGETFTWTLYPVLSWGEEKGTGTVVVENGLDREVEVLLNGQPAGRLAPGASRAYPRIVEGQVKLAAREPDGETVADGSLDVVAGNLARWEIGKGQR